MTSKQVIRILKADGWILKDQKRSSHQQYVHLVKEGKVTVPVHGNKDIPIGTLLSIFRQAGIKRPKT